jgi:lysosomal alpha-mannosidase
MLRFIRTYLWIAFLWSLGWISCPGSEGLVVHVIPHSHCDAGYIKTFDQYYKDDVNSTITTVLQALKDDKSKRFVWEEVSYWYRWWLDSPFEEHLLMSNLVKSGQLEFIGGGWVMHDEAVADAVSVMNQLTLGIGWLNGSLATRPQIGWHIDPFGHSAFTPYLYGDMDYKAFVLNRIPDPLKQKFKKEKHLEFHWYPPYLKTPKPIFAHVLDSHYSTPFIFGLDVEERAASFVNTCEKRSEWYLTDHLLIPFGNDFAFKDAPQHFKKMDEIIQYINSHKEKYKITVRYSTLSEYFDAVLNSGATFPEYKGDFLPYVACSPCLSEDCNGPTGIVTVPCGLSDAFWSGFYSSKPAQKLLSYHQDDMLRWEKVLSAYTHTVLPPHVGDGDGDTVDEVATSALMQHHDAITGTSYPGCYQDYNNRLNAAINVSQSSISHTELGFLCGANSTKWPVPEWDSVKSLSALLSDKERIVLVVVGNSLPFNRSEVVSLDLPEGLCVQVVNFAGSVIPSQVVGGKVYFPVSSPGVGVTTNLYLRRRECTSHVEPAQPKGSFSVTNGVVTLRFNDNMQVSSISTPSYGTLPFNHTYTQYHEKESVLDLVGNVCGGTNVYTFVPKSSEGLTPKVPQTKVTASGPLVWEVQQVINEYINHSIRLYKSMDAVNFDLSSQQVEWQTNIGPLPESFPMSVTSKFSTGVRNNQQVKTFSQGYFPMIREYNKAVPLQGNFYPLVHKVAIGDAAVEVSVVTQRPMGVAGSSEGALEMNLHRRIPLLTDPRGNDATIMKDHIRLGVFSKGKQNQLFSDPSIMTDRMSASLSHPLKLALVNIESGDLPKWREDCKQEWSGIRLNPFPQEVRLLSLEFRGFVPILGFNPVYVQYGVRLLNVLEDTSANIDVSLLFPTTVRLGNILTTSPDFRVTHEVHINSTVTLPPLEVVSLLISAQLGPFD